MVLENVFSPSLIKTQLESSDKEEVFEELIELFVAAHPEISREKILAAVKSREDKLSTGIKSGIALPHAQTDAVSGVTGVIGIAHDGIDYDALDGKPVYVIFLLLSNRDACSLHLRALKRLAMLLETPAFFKEILEQKDANSVYATVCKFEEMLAIPQ